MATEIKMPLLGQTSNEVTLLRWFVSEGEEITAGKPLCEVETDKVTMEMESFESGKILKLFSSPGSVIKTGEVIAIIGNSDEAFNNEYTKDIIIKGNTNDEEKDKIKNIKISKDNNLPKTNDLEFENKRNKKASKLVENLARIKNIDLNKVKGTGPGNYITRDDLDNFENSLMDLKEISLSQNQISIAKNLLKSKIEIPHYYLKREINADKFIKWRASSKDAGNIDISMYSVLIYATANSLKKMPILNGFYQDNKIILRKDINIGFALSIDNELYAPVIKNADTKNIIEIDKELKNISINIKSKNLQVTNISGGTFTVTNLGMFGIDEFLAVINLNQSGIFSIGKLRKILFIDSNESIKIRNVFTLNASFDHRFVNGKLGAEFIEIFSKIFEEEFSLM